MSETLNEPDILVAKYPIEKASLMQFAGPVSFAGEVATNLFVAGGTACTLRIGSYVRSQDPATKALFEDFVPNRINERDEVVLQLVCDRDPAQGFTDTNPFEVNLWPLSRAGKPVSIEQAMGDKFALIPEYAPSEDYLVAPFASDQSMFLLRKAISSIFAMSITQGSPDVGLVLRRGPETVESRLDAHYRKVKKTFMEKKRDAQGHIVFHEASTPDGKPIFDPIFDRAGKPLFDIHTGEIRRQRRLDYELAPVEREVDELYNVKVEFKRTALYLLVARNAVISQDSFLQLATGESAYDPTWMLKSVLSGECKDKLPYWGGMSTAERK